MHQVPRHRLLGSWGHWVTTYPGRTLLLCSLLAVGSILTAVLTIEVKPDRNALISEDLDWSGRYADYRRDFPRWDDVIVCLEGDPEDERVDALSRRLAASLLEHDDVSAADAGFHLSDAGPGLWKIAPQPLFHNTLEKLRKGRNVAASETASSALLTMLEQEEDDAAADAADAATALAPFIDAIAGRPVTFDLLAPLQGEWQPLETASGRIRIIQLTLRKASEASVAGIAETLSIVRTHVEESLHAWDAQDIPWGITGIPAIESDETQQATYDSTIASCIAFGLITAMLVLVFRRIRIPLMAAISLVIGIAWSFGWAALSIGHLQLLSMVFSAILIGLGIDFALHIVTRLKEVHTQFASLPEAMAQTFRDVGPGLLTGAVTTAVAFGCTATSAFLGMAEMGIIAAGGVLLCLIAIMSCFPALLALNSRWRQDLDVIRPVGTPLLRRLSGPLHNHAGVMLVVAILATGLLAAAGSRLEYDSNIMNLQPPGLEAVSWQQKLASEPGEDLWSGLVLSEPSSAPDLVANLRGLENVSEVGGMGWLLPPDLLERQQLVNTTAAQPVHAETAPTGLGFVANVLMKIRDRLPANASSEMADLVRQIDQALDAWRDLDRDTATRRQRMETLEIAWASARTELMSWIDAALGPEPPGPSDLPPILRSNWIGEDGRWLLRVAPVVSNQSILDPDRLADFVEQVRTVAPNVLGPPVQIFESSRLIVRAYTHAGILALAAVLLVLLADFRSICDAFSAILPVLVGFAGTLGIMGLSGIDLNFANLMVLPMIFGIGVDSGVHVVHRWRSNPDMRPPGLWGGTGVGILLTTATTAIGFGTLMIAEHRGIQSLAIVMVVGLGLTLVACWTVLPCVLRLRQQVVRAFRKPTADPR